MPRIIIFIFTFFFIVSCGKKRNAKVVEKPANLISQEQMAKVLVDFHLAEEAIQKESRAKSKFYSNLYYYSLFEKHNIVAADFDSSVAYYIQIPEKFDKIYADVIEELEKLQTEVSLTDKQKEEIDKKRIKSTKPDKEDEKGSGIFKKIKEKAVKEQKKEGE